jgi:hypothetical protein
MCFKHTIIATISLLCSSFNPALADCSTVPFRFRIEANPVLTTNGVTDGVPCSHVFSSRTIVYEKSNIEKQAKNGKVEKISLIEFNYTPKKGFKGQDTYSIKICGKTTTNETGCVKVNYEMEVR